MPQRVLYLHGFASGPGSKKGQFFRDRLRGLGIELEIPDLSQGNFEQLTITSQLQVVGRAAAGEAVSLIGSSLGGYVAALYAARHPEVQRLVLLAPAFSFGRRFAASLPPQELDNWKRTGYLPVYHYAEARPARVGYQLVEDARRYEEYPATVQPVLIFHGTRDTVVPPALSEQFARQRPNVRLVLVDSDHELLSAVEAIWQEVAQAFRPNS